MKSATYSIVQRHKSSGIKTWYLRTYQDGKTSFKSLKTESKKQATEMLERIKLAKYLPQAVDPNDVPIVGAVDGWVKSVEYEFGPDGLTTRAYKARIKHFSRFAERCGINTFSQLSPQIMEEFARSLDGKASKTVHEIVKVVNACVTWTEKNYSLPHRDLFGSIKLPQGRTGRVEFWTSDEVERLLAAAPSESFRAFWALMAYAGLRFAEARNLTVENVHGNTITVINGKMGKDADVPISKKLASIIDPFLDHEGLLIPKTDVPMRADHAIFVLRAAASVAKISGKVSHHKLRHSFASELLRAGVNTKAVQELMRLEAESMAVLFKHYAHVRRSDLDDAVNRI